MRIPKIADRSVARARKRAKALWIVCAQYLKARILTLTRPSLSQVSVWLLVLVGPLTGAAACYISDSVLSTHRILIPALSKLGWYLLTALGAAGAVTISLGISRFRELTEKYHLESQIARRETLGCIPAILFSWVIALSGLVWVVFDGDMHYVICVIAGLLLASIAVTLCHFGRLWRMSGPSSAIRVVFAHANLGNAKSRIAAVSRVLDEVGDDEWLRAAMAGLERAVQLCESAASLRSLQKMIGAFKWRNKKVSMYHAWPSWFQPWIMRVVTDVASEDAMLQFTEMFQSAVDIGKNVLDSYPAGCSAERRSLIRLTERLAGVGLAVIAVSQDTDEGGVLDLIDGLSVIGGAAVDCAVADGSWDPVNQVLHALGTVGARALAAWRLQMVSAIGDAVRDTVEYAYIQNPGVVGELVTAYVQICSLCRACELQFELQPGMAEVLDADTVIAGLQGNLRWILSVLVGRNHTRALDEIGRFKDQIGLEASEEYPLGEE